MSNPTLTRTRVVVAYTASDGFRAEFGAKGGIGTKHRVTGMCVPPEHALIAGLEELARITALFGFEDAALEAFNAARQRVFDWRKEGDKA